MIRLPSQGSYWLLGIMVLGLASLPIIWSINNEITHYQRLRQSREAMALFVSLLRTYEAASVERQASTALLGRISAEQAVHRRTQLTLARSVTDERIRNLEEMLRRATCTRCSNLVNSLALVRARLVPARATMDALHADAARQRAHGAILGAIHDMIAANEPFQLMLNQCTLGVAEFSADAAQPLQLARDIADMREYAVRFGSLLIEPLVMGRYLTRDDRERVAIMEGRVMQLRDIIALRLASKPYRSQLRHSADSVTEAYFDNAYMYARQLIDAGERSVHRTVQPADFVAVYRKGTDAIARFRDAALAPATAQLDLHIERLSHTLLAITLVSGLILAALAGVLVLFRGHYVSPLEGLARGLLSLGRPRAATRAGHREAMMASLSHDMRSPQASILALLDMARTTQTYRMTPDLFAKIESHARRTLKMVDDFVQLSELHVLKYRPADVDAYGILLDAIDALTVAAHRRGITLQLCEPDGHAYVVRAEPDSLFRAIVNVIDNAIKYGPEHDTVHCCVRRTRRHVEIAIRDRGPGIRPQDMPHIFKRFRRFATTAIGDAPASGNGLGLAFARAAVRKARGQIRCRSTVGVGTEFTIVLPAR